MGIKEFVIIHDRDKTYHIENPKYLQKSERKLIKLQRQLSKKQKAIKIDSRCKLVWIQEDAWIQIQMVWKKDNKSRQILCK